MTEHQDLQINMIRCQAKIRTTQFMHNNQNTLPNRFLRKPILLASLPVPSPQQIQPILYKQLEGKEYAMEQTDYTLSTFSSLKLIQDDNKSIQSFSKSDNFQNYWSKLETQDLESFIFKDDLTKKSQFNQFSEIEKTSYPSNNTPSDINDFQESTILSNYHFQEIHKSLPSQSLKNYTFLERALEDKNVEMVKILMSKNQQKNILEKKIFDLQFQLFTQKRNSDQTINCLALQLKNIEGICQTQQIQIKGLKKEIEMNQQQRQKSQILHQNKVLLLLQNIRNLQINCFQLKKQIQSNICEVDQIKKQNVTLLNTIQRFREQRQNIQRVEVMKQKLYNDFESNLILLDVQSIKSDDESNEQSQSNELIGESDSSIESHVSYLQGLIKQYQNELLDNKKKMKQQKKLILSLQVKVQELQDVCISLQIANKMVADANDQIIRIQLKQLNSVFQYETI